MHEAQRAREAKALESAPLAASFIWDLFMSGMIRSGDLVTIITRIRSEAGKDMATVLLTELNIDGERAC